MENTYVLDARRMDTEGVHSYLRALLPLPDYYGNNLDALYDCLTDLSETQLIVTHTGSADVSFSRVRQVLLDAEEENPGLCVHLLEKEAID